MTERGETALLQSPHGLDIGPSALRASDSGLEIDIQERAMPFGQRVVGQVSVSFARPSEECFELDGVGEQTTVTFSGRKVRVRWLTDPDACVDDVLTVGVEERRPV